MERRQFLKFFSVSPIGAVPTSDTRADEPVVNAAAFGAIGNGEHDDTIALQNAIDYAVANGKSCFIPPGTFKITRTLSIGNETSSSLFQAFKLFGAGKALDRRGGIGGTVIQLDGTGHTAIIRMEKNVWRRSEISDIGFECLNPSGATYGVLFSSTEFSGHALRRVSVYQANIAFGILRGTGVNGEFTNFNNCTASHVNKFFYTNAGQAYVQYFEHCTCQLNAGGTYFHLDLESGGGGINVIDFNATGERINDRPSNTSLLINNNSSSCLNFFGGRIEHLTQLYEHLGDTTSLHVTAIFAGLQLTVDRLASSTKPFIHINNAPDIISINSCTIQGTSGAEVINIQTRDSWAYVLVKGCFFDALSTTPIIISNFNDMFNQVHFEDCKSTVPVPGRDRPTSRPVPLEKHLHNEIGAIGRRKSFSENGWIQSGQPQNLLVKPQFTNANGRALTADVPWKHYGSSNLMNAYDWNYIGPHPQSSSPWAKLIELAPKSGVYQNIIATDLSSDKVSYSLNGIPFHLVTYQAMITRLAGNVNLIFSLSNSLTNEIYDEIDFTDNSGSEDFVRLVTLVATVARQVSSSYVRLKIENISSNWATVDFSWQLASSNYNPAFLASDLRPTTLTNKWAISAENARFWHRLSLPYKSDTFGSESTRPLDDLQSDIYLSKTTERVTVQANGRWWPMPRMCTAQAEPAAGRWAHGDLIFNSGPIVGEYLGWVQVTPGNITAEQHWMRKSHFDAGTRVYHVDRVYECIRNGISSDTTGPTETSERVADGSCIWKYIGTLAAVACADVWKPKLYAAGETMHKDENVYECVNSGMSFYGPSGTDDSGADGAVIWKYIGPLAIFKRFGLISP